MSKPIRILLAAAALTLVSLACGEPSQSVTDDRPENPPALSPDAEVTHKGNRILELDVNPAESGDFDQAVDFARQLGADSVRLSIYWDEIESSPGVYDPDPNWLAVADQYYSAQDLSISLVISVLDTTEIRLPEDLEGRSFADPLVLERFQGLLDYVKTQLTDVELISLAIGNEIDGVLGGDSSAWQEYQAFYDPAAEYAREIWPGLPVSTKVTFDGLTGNNARIAREIFENSPVVMTTYYPLKSDFTVRDPEVVSDDLQTLSDIFPEKEIHITEIGYPSSEVNHSSPEQQAEFIQATFQAWDDHANQITVLSYSWLTDLPESAVKDLESYYGVSSKAFGEFLRTLGLRTYPGSGQDKIGFQTFQAEAEARGW